MRVGIVIRARWFRASIDMEGYAAAIRRRGDEPILFCHGSDVPDPDVSVVEAAPAEMEDPAFWRRQGLDMAIVFCWLRASRLVGALRQAGVRTVLRADSDGCVSVRVFPRAAWLATVSPATSPADRLRRMKHWLHRYLALYAAEDAELAATIAAADAVAIEFPRALENLSRVLRHADRGDLSGKLHVVPHSLRDDFMAGVPDLTRPASPNVLCLARWDDPQKDAPLCCEVVARVLAARPEARFTVIGPTAPAAFRRLAAEPRVALHERVDPMKIPETLAAHTVFLSSSRWEGQSIIGMEALCSGLSIVAPPVPCFEDLVGPGTRGRISRGRSPHALAAALVDELTAWESGARTRQGVAGTSRDGVTNDAVVASLLALAGGRPAMDAPQ